MSQVFGSSELMADVQKRELCIGCGACVDLCPYFMNYKGKTSQLFPCTLEQGRCYAYCPKAEVDLDELCRKTRNLAYDGSPLGSYQKVLAARAGKKMPPGNVQAGGTVTALMTFAMQKGLVDAAALTDRQDLVPVPRLVTDWRNVAGCATSKFMAAPTLAALNTAVRKGYQRIGVVGTSCQIMAVAQMCSNPLGKAAYNVPVALSVGLFCNWALETRGLMDLLAAKMDISGIRTMDIPPPPANIMVLQTDTKPVEISLSEIKPLIPHTCYICLDMTSELADLSVGMLEGKTGWNTLIIRSGTGAGIVDRALNEGFIETTNFPDEDLQHLEDAASAKKGRSLRTLIRHGLLNNENDQHSAIRIPPEIVTRILS